MEIELTNNIILVVLLGVGIVAGIIDAIAGGGGLICLPILLAIGIPVHTA